MIDEASKLVQSKQDNDPIILMFIINIIHGSFNINDEIYYI
jgi:hypothetical protein